MNANTKAIRKAIQKAAADFKVSMFSRRSCVDAGGRHWKLEYSIYFWHEETLDWGKADWDDYSTSGSQRGLFEDLVGALKMEKRLAVVVQLICESRTNAECLFDLSGNPIQKL
jgi:hypothetical protein